jgi:hypothetical protein
MTPRASTLLALSLLALALGCANNGSARSARNKPTPSPAPAPAGQPPISNTDPCAMRLHDICGGLLLYYLQNQDLPASLTELSKFPGVDEGLEFVCPESKKPYVYIPQGIFLPEKNAYIVLYDPEPVHAGYRWAVQVQAPEPGKPLVTRVIAQPERFFVTHPPAPAR